MSIALALYLVIEEGKTLLESVTQQWCIDDCAEVSFAAHFRPSAK